MDCEPEGDGSERRRHARVEAPLKARYLGPDGREHPCLVVNISAGGALLRAKTSPAESETIVLYVDEVGRFECRVVRSGKHSFAVDYRGRRSKTARTADALTVTLNYPREGKSDLRAAPRIKQDEPALVTLENGEQIPCSIIDISLTGASIEIDPRPPLGARLVLGKTSAKVVRRHEKGVGVIFSGPAARMEDAIKNAAKDRSSAPDGADLASSFGRKGHSA
jgi:hypothetical protein